MSHEDEFIKFQEEKPEADGSIEGDFLGRYNRLSDCRGTVYKKA
ncbi:hypothetical protein [Hornefia butyriciproducens]|nr:hypothetical protein [Hornefia butyriciproducens]MDD7020738.1 hypothetical protein [Hornefia butyriciproducens]